MMDLTEGLIVACVDALGAGRTIPFGDKVVNFEPPPFQRAGYAALFREHVGCDMADEIAVAVRAAADSPRRSGRGDSSTRRRTT